MNNKKYFKSISKNNKYFTKLVHLIKTSIRIQVMLAFMLCILFSLLVFFVSSPFFVSQDRHLDFTEGIVTIDERARDLVTQLNRIDENLNGLITELGNKDSDFRDKFLNQSIPSSK
ncbi:MAG TPA: hypothetical protein VJ546_02345, partial [Bacillales bacterium]|nr:hypothetical protein [Bacillales bacterium]